MKQLYLCRYGSKRNNKHISKSCLSRGGVGDFVSLCNMVRAEDARGDAHKGKELCNIIDAIRRFFAEIHYFIKVVFHILVKFICLKAVH